MKRYSILLAAVTFLAMFIATTTPAKAAFPGGNGYIVFNSDRSGTDNFRIYRMNPDGSAQARLPFDAFNCYDTTPAWSPDGSRIAFESKRDFGYGREVYVMNADGSNQIRLTNNSANDSNPDWSPDGSRIAFNSNRDGDDEIYVMNADGTGLMQLTDNTASDNTPDWSPDGTRIVFESTRDPESIHAEIYVMNADGTGQIRLTENDFADSRSVWSPDGTKIAFIRWILDTNAEIYVMNADGTGQIRLTTNSSQDYSPSWQPIPQDVNFEIRGEPIPIPSAHSGAYVRYVGDLDDDGKLDIVYAYGDPYYSYVIERDGDTFELRASLYGYCHVVAEVDGDDYPDMLVTIGSSAAKIFEATGDNTYGEKKSMSFPRKIEWPTRVGDSDGDGKGEFLIGVEAYGVYIYEAASNDTYAYEGTLSGSSLTNVRDAGVYDLDADGYPETVITRYYPYNQTCVFKGISGTRTQMFCSTATFVARSLGDLDGDGLGEVIGDDLHHAGGWITENLLILELNETNDGFDEVYRAPIHPNSSYRYQAGDVIDFDSDGQSELWQFLDSGGSGYPDAFALAHLEKNTINTMTHFYNSGTLLESFTGEVRGLLAIGDTDGDGRFELAVVQGDQIHILEQITNQPPVADPNGPYTGNEGSPVIFDGAGSSDPDGDPLTYDWTLGDDNIGTGETLVHTYADNGDYEVCLTVNDPDGLTDTKCTTATIANVAPTVGAITPDLTLVEVGTTINATANFTDPGADDTHTAIWDWDDTNQCDTTIDLNCDLIQGAGSGNVTGSHTYTAPGVYTIRLTVTDNDGGLGESVFQFVVAYDPSAGFVTGGGWINSPEGAYAADPELTGKANFGFVSKYKKGATIPTGNTEFQFKAGDLNFHSDSYEWLVVTGSDYAKFKGSGTINGEGDYKFMLWAGDDDPDTFRIKIWEEDDLGNETVVYDNGFHQEIGGGSIKVHTK